MSVYNEPQPLVGADTPGSCSYNFESSRLKECSLNYERELLKQGILLCGGVPLFCQVETNNSYQEFQLLIEEVLATLQL